jgi:hypothetical protein
MATEQYLGSCQCGCVAFEVDLDLDEAVTCNCSRCRRLGAVLAFAAKAAFRLGSGEGEVSEYLFNTRSIRHFFCRTCGIQCYSFGAMPDGTEIAAVNVNCLDGVDARSLPTTAHDGASA